MKQVRRHQKKPVYVRPQEDIDAEQLKLISVFHYIVGGLLMMMSCTSIAFCIIGANKLEIHEGTTAEAWLIIKIGVWVLVGCWTAAALMMLSGYFVNRRRARLYTLLVVLIDVVLFPFGTLLAVFTLTVMFRQSIREMYRVSTGAPAKVMF